MIRIDQIKVLEDRVNRAIELIKTLREENNTLRAGLDSAQKKIDELEKFIDTFKTEQGEIEEGILRALENLDKIEDEILITPKNSSLQESTFDKSGKSEKIEAEKGEKVKDKPAIQEGDNPKEENSSELDIF